MARARKSARGEGGARPDQDRVTLAAVALAAQVSVGTAFRVVNNYANVDAALRDRVLSACRKLGFSPRVRKGSIALIVGRHSPALRVGYTSAMTALLLHQLAARHRPAEIYAAEDAARISQSSHVEGAIAVVFDDRLANLKGLEHFPVLTLNHPIDGVHAIFADHHAQGKMAAEHLLGRGHKKIGFLANEPDEWGSRERLRGYQDALKANRATRRLHPQEAGWVQYTLGKTTLDVKDVLARWLKDGVTALLNFSEDTSLEVLHLLTDWFKLRIGREISTICVEDLDIYRYLTPPQTAIHQPLEQMAERAVERIAQLCDARQGGQADSPVIRECLGSRLIERDSVARL